MKNLNTYSAKIVISRLGWEFPVTVSGTVMPAPVSEGAGYYVEDVTAVDISGKIWALTQAEDERASEEILRQN